MIKYNHKHHAPTSGFIKYFIGRIWMWFFGWDVLGQIPQHKKFILIGAPHTSNWDFPFGLAAMFVARLKISWLGKNTLFKQPYKYLMHWLGGIPVVRDSKQGVVDQIAAKFNAAQKLVIAIAPEGTRSKRDYWKSGFYWIALKAQVPIVCCYLDYKNKKASFDMNFVPTGNMADDMNLIREFYKNINGKRPEQMSRIRLPDEDK